MTQVTDKEQKSQIINPDFSEEDDVLFQRIKEEVDNVFSENESARDGDSDTGQQRQTSSDEKASDFGDEITAEYLLNKKIEKIPCLIGDVFQAVGLATVAGSSDVGKSAFLRQLAVAVATQQPTFLDWPIQAKHSSVIYVSTEDDENATAFLLLSLNKSQRKNSSQYSRLRFVFETDNLLAELDRRLAAAPADLVVIDAFMDLFGEDSNSSNRIRNFLNDYQQLAQKHECLFLFLHHTGKRTDDLTPSKHNLIGGQGYEGKMRLVVELRRDWHDPERRHLCIVKGNYLPDSEKTSSRVLDWDGSTFTFGMTDERVPFEQLGKPQPQSTEDLGKAKYDEIQAARKKGLKGDALAKELKMSKSYISKIEDKYGPKTDSEDKVP